MTVKLIINSPPNNRIEIETYRNIDTDRQIRQVIYNDRYYMLDAVVNNQNSNLVSAIFRINGDELEDKAIITLVEKDGTHIQSRGYNQIFSQQYGVIQIEIELIYANDLAIQSWFTEQITVAVKEYKIDIVESLKSMVNYIYKSDISLISDATKLDANYSVKKESSIDCRISATENILNIYEENIMSFSLNSKFKYTQEYEISDIDKLHDISDKTIEFMSTHPEYMQECSKSPIKYKEHYIMPYKTLTGTRQISYKTYENLFVIMFMNTLMSDINTMLEKVTESINCNKIDLKLDTEIQSGYIDSHVIFEDILLGVLKDRQAKLYQLQEKILQIDKKYKEILINTNEVLQDGIEMTPILCEVRHYRSIFNAYRNWLDNNSITNIQQQKTMQFNAAYKVYEFYCIVRIKETLEQLGFTENKEEAKVYKYTQTENYYKKDTGCKNTFYFHKDDIEITLYYQPVVYSFKNSSDNNIGLYKRKDGYYTPDFILKKVRHFSKNETVEESEIKGYMILDSKFSTFSTLKSYRAMDESLLKYKINIGDFRDSYNGEYIIEEHPRFVWLLGGRDEGVETEGHRVFEATNNGQQSKLRQDNSAGIARLTPRTKDIDFTEGLGKLLKIFIEGNNLKH